MCIKIEKNLKAGIRERKGGNGINERRSKKNISRMHTYEAENRKKIRNKLKAKYRDKEERKDRN